MLKGDYRFAVTGLTKCNDDGSVTVSFEVDGLEEIVWWLLGWSGDVGSCSDGARAIAHTS